MAQKYYIMTLMRVFVAIDLPKDLKEKIFVISQKISRNFSCKLVEKENLHLTLVFLGEKSEQEVEKIKKAVADSTRSFGKIFLTIESLELFPLKRPRGIWFKVGGEEEKLKELHKKIIDELVKQKIPVEDLRFTPHICILRFKDGVRKQPEKIGLEENFIAEKITVFQSKLSPKGPTYFKLKEFGLE